MGILKAMLRPKKINIWSQLKSKRVFVGTLLQKEGSYFFEYDQRYRLLRNAIPLGPELPLLKKCFSSKTMFSIFMDRIPSKENPSYADYCRQWGLSPNEKDVFVLLTTIGRRGPSTFVFEPGVEERYGIDEIKKFREKLTLNQRDFSSLFGLNQATFARLETGKTENALILDYIKLCEQVPQALKWLVEKRGQYIHDEKRVYIQQLTERKAGS